MRRIVAVLCAGVAVSSAAEAKKAQVPEELAGLIAEGQVNTGDVFNAGPGELVAAKVVAAAQRLGGLEVIVWEEQRRWKVKDADGRKLVEDATFVVAADVETRKAVLREKVKRKFDLVSPEAGKSAGSFAWTPAWKDLDGDGEPELILTRKSSTSKSDPAEKVFQVRYGAVRLVPRDGVSCARDGAALAPIDEEAGGAPVKPTDTQAAQQAFTKALAGKDAQVVRCALLAVAMTWPSDGGAFEAPRAGSPVFLLPRPGPAKKPVHVALYLDTAGFVTEAGMKGAKVVSAPYDLAFLPSREGLPDGDPDHQLGTGGTPAPNWIDLLELDGVIWVVADVTNNNASGDLGDEGSKPYERRDVFIVNAATNDYAASEPLEVKKPGLAVSRVATWQDADGDGISELTVAPRKGKKGTVSWRYDKVNKGWTLAK